MIRIDFVGRGLVLSAILLLNACSTLQEPPVRPVASVKDVAATNTIDPGKLIIHTLPIGAGNCQIAQCPSGNKLIFMDCGSGGAGSQNWTADDARTYVRGLVNTATEIAVTVSHPHVDHYRYLPTVLDNLPVRNLYLSRQLSSYNAEFQHWAAQQQVNTGMAITTYPGFYHSTNPEAYLGCLAPNGHGGWQSDVQSYILAVNAGTGANEGSMVLAMRYGSFRTLFTGDMTDVTEYRVQVPAGLGTLQTKVLTSPHHGSESHGSNSASWAAATRPELVLFSAGTRFHHPRCTAVDVYWGYVGNDSPGHTFHCGNTSGWVNETNTRNILTTDSNGLIRVQASQDGTFNFNWGP